jgi:hypothetical protein
MPVIAGIKESPAFVLNGLMNDCAAIQPESSDATKAGILGSVIEKFHALKPSLTESNASIVNSLEKQINAAISKLSSKDLQRPLREKMGSQDVLDRPVVRGEESEPVVKRASITPEACLRQVRGDRDTALKNLPQTKQKLAEARQNLEEQISPLKAKVRFGIGDIALSVLSLGARSSSLESI